MNQQAELRRISDRITGLTLSGGSIEELEALVQESMRVMDRIKTDRQRRFEKVLDLVREAIEGQDPNAHACEVTGKIMKLLDS